MVTAGAEEVEVIEAGAGMTTEEDTAETGVTDMEEAVEEVVAMVMRDINYFLN